MQIKKYPTFSARQKGCILKISLRGALKKQSTFSAGQKGGCFTIKMERG